MNNIILSNFLETLIQDINMQNLDENSLTHLHKFFLDFNTKKHLYDTKDKDLYKYLVTGWYIHNLIDNKNTSN